MSSTGVSILVPLVGQAAEAAPVDDITRFLQSTGFTFEVLPLGGDEYGALLRRGVAEAKGESIVIVDAALPYAVSAIGDAVAMIQSGATDVVFAATREDDLRHGLLRWILAPILPDPRVRLKAFSSAAAKLIVAETKLAGGACDLEIAFLANKYGFRVERLHVDINDSIEPSFSALGGIAPAISIRLINRRMGYRAARRCPVCFSSEVWSCAQIPGNVVRACKRCKCRYLNQFTEDEETGPVRRVLRPHPPAQDAFEETHSASTAREKTSARRMNLLRSYLTPLSRLLEIGVRDGSFGVAAAREYEYVGIDHGASAARAARARGLEVYCATVTNFVNTGPAFDAIALFHVFENMADPHDALGRIKDLLKPGGVLFLTTFDTEGLIYLLTERKRIAQNFRTHLILYSRSALIELLEHSGYEIEEIGPDFEYRDRKFLRHRIASRWPRLAPVANAVLKMLPNPLLASSGSIRIVARRRAGAPLDVRAIRSVEPTHAR